MPGRRHGCALARRRRCANACSDDHKRSYYTTAPPQPQEKIAIEPTDRGTLSSGAAGPRLACILLEMASAVKVRSGFSLARLDLDRRLKDQDSYQHQLSKLQVAMLELEQIYRVERRRGIIAVEGWDASGKGGAIQRLTERLDPRWVQVWSIGRPTPDEQGRHFLWRFWQRLPPPAPSRFSTAHGTDGSLSNGSKHWPAPTSGNVP